MKKGMYHCLTLGGRTPEEKIEIAETPRKGKRFVPTATAFRKQRGGKLCNVGGGDSNIIIIVLRVLHRRFTVGIEKKKKYRTIKGTGARKQMDRQEGQVCTNHPCPAKKKRTRQVSGEKTRALKEEDISGNPPAGAGDYPSVRGHKRGGDLQKLQ